MVMEKKNWIKMYWEDIKYSSTLRFSIVIILSLVFISLFYNSLIISDLEFVIGWIGIYFILIIGVLILISLGWLVIVVVAEFLNKGRSWMVLIQEVNDRNEREKGRSDKK